MPSYKLTYFDVRGRGELSRYVFYAAGKDFEDNRVGGESWLELKPSKSMQGVSIRLKLLGLCICVVFWGRVGVLFFILRIFFSKMWDTFYGLYKIYGFHPMFHVTARPYLCTYVRMHLHISYLAFKIQCTFYIK